MRVNPMESLPAVEGEWTVAYVYDGKNWRIDP